jgi:predicted TIM-barrel fold metal-dependent hydrolase
MDRVDVNCLLGHWPFRKILRNSFEDLQKVHAQNGIAYGYVSSINSILYHDPFEGDEELHEIIKGSAYKHVLTVNPDLPGFKDDIRRGIEEFGIKGVRIYPCYHGYSLRDHCVQDLCETMKEYGLPLFITIRMEDERLSYLFHAFPIEMEDIASFINMNKEVTMVLLNIRYSEVLALKDTINTHSNVFFDTSGLKDLLFVVEKLMKEIKPEKLLYGSLHPLYCLKSSLLLVEKAEIDGTVKDMILGKNASFLEK